MSSEKKIDLIKIYTTFIISVKLQTNLTTEAVNMYMRKSFISLYCRFQSCRMIYASFTLLEKLRGTAVDKWLNS